MLTEERLQEILKLLGEKGSVSTQELMAALDISESTVRRDLTTLDEQGRLLKVRGGALVREDTYSTAEATMSQKKTLHLEEKKAIARYAASLLEADDFVFLDAGSTTELMIDYMTERDVTFVTNAVSHAKKLSEKGYITYILGGEFKATTEAIVGDEVIESLQKYNFTKGFWGTNGINRKVGFSTPDVKEAMVKKISMQHCAERYVLGDPSKFSQISCVKFADFVNAVIITTGLSDKSYAGCENIIEI